MSVLLPPLYMRNRECFFRPVHARQVSPEVTGTVSSRDLDSVDHHRVTLQTHTHTHSYYSWCHGIKGGITGFMIFTAVCTGPCNSPRGIVRCPSCRWHPWRPRSRTSRRTAGPLLLWAWPRSADGKTQRTASLCLLEQQKTIRDQENYHFPTVLKLSDTPAPLNEE